MSTYSSKFFAAKTLPANLLATRDVWYIVEPSNWAIRYVGSQITSHLNQQDLLAASLTTTPWGIRHSLIHFGSLPTLASARGLRLPHPSCRAIATIFHIASDSHRQRIREVMPHIKVFHTAATSTAQELQALGIAPEQIHLIPLGVDPQIFQPVSAASRQPLRARLGLGPDTVVIGSFQKDGVGWGAGLTPKLEKGPDIFVETLALLSQAFPIHALLVGPSRGYVTRQLKLREIPFTHIGEVKSVADVAPYYHALDAYLIASRVEGGPLSLLEAWASGIPVVTTPVGMVNDIGRSEQNLLVAKPEPVALAAAATRLIQEATLRDILTSTALIDVQQFNWATIARRYYEDLYRL